MKAKCTDCGEMVEVADGRYAMHGTCSGGGKDCRSDSVARTFVIDFSEPLAKPRHTADGFLLVDAVVRSVGTFPYADGPEIAAPEENRKAANSFDRVPLYFGHPPGMVKPENAIQQRPIGAVTNPRVMDDGRIAASLCVWDGDAIGSIESRKTTQLSSGYTCRVVDENGQRFQRDVVANHVALLAMGRHGKAASLKLDGGADVFSGIGKTDFNMLLSNEVKGDIQMPHLLRFDGLSFEVNDANAQAQLEKFLGSLKKDAEEKLGKEKSRADAADKAKTDAEAKLAEKQKAIDTLEAKRDSLESQMKTDAAMMLESAGSTISLSDARDKAKFDAFMAGIVSKAAAVRTALVVEASKHVSKNVKLDEMSDFDIKKAVVLAFDKDAKLDGKSADYVQALFEDRIAAAAKNKVTAIDSARIASSVQVGGRSDIQPSDPKSAYEAMVAREKAANVKSAR